MLNHQNCLHKRSVLLRASKPFSVVLSEEGKAEDHDFLRSIWQDELF